MGDTFLEFCAPYSNADGKFLVNPPLSVYEQTLGTLPLGDDTMMIEIEYSRRMVLRMVQELCCPSRRGSSLSTCAILWRIDMRYSSSVAVDQYHHHSIL